MITVDKTNEAFHRLPIELGFFIACLGFVLFGCGGAPSDRESPNRPQPNMNNHASPVASNAVNSRADTLTGDTRFLDDAAHGGLAEVTLGRLAVQKAQSPEVKAFAQKMIDDHSKASEELKALALKKNYAVPADLSPKHRQLADRLGSLSGAEFDKAYVEAMTDDHEEDVEKFASEAEKGTDADVRAFAAKTLPTLRMHLDMIRGLEQKLSK